MLRAGWPASRAKAFRSNSIFLGANPCVGGYPLSLLSFIWFEPLRNAMAFLFFDLFLWTYNFTSVRCSVGCSFDYIKL